MVYTDPLDFTARSGRSGGPRERGCGDVPYEANSDVGAFDICARGTSCSTARAIARDAEDKPDRFTTRGFTCTGKRRSDSMQLPRLEFVCRSGERRVTFDRTQL